MADSILRTADGLEYQYKEYLWGDVIEGDKEVLQRMGIGVGMAFPGEPGANKRQITTTDPRGFRCKLKTNYQWSQFSYSAHIDHPGRSYHNPENDWKESFPGVLCRESGHSQTYKGTAEALMAAGVVPAGMFPGMPGMRSTRVTILADGSLPTGHRNSNVRSDVAMTIEKISKNTYLVLAVVPSEQGKKRNAASFANWEAWEARMAAMPRAPRLDQAIRREVDEACSLKRAGLYIAWSRPKFVPGFNPLPQGPFAQ